MSDDIEDAVEFLLIPDRTDRSRRCGKLMAAFKVGVARENKRKIGHRNHFAKDQPLKDFRDE